MGSLDGKTALVTGAEGGIGSATARRLADEGAALVLVDLRDPVELADELMERGVSVRAEAVDVSSAGATEEMFRRVDGVDILINNAGILRDRTIRNMQLDDWQRVLDVNLTAAFLLSKLALPAMLERGWGRIVNLSSISGITGNFGQTNYAAAKAGLLGFTKSLALETARKGVTVNAVAPGFIDTAMMRSVPDHVLRDFESKVPVGRLGRPEEVAATIAFLCSPDAGYLTGQTLQVNGGYRM